MPNYGLNSSVCPRAISRKKLKVSIKKCLRLLHPRILENASVDPKTLRRRPISFKPIHKFFEGHLRMRHWCWYECTKATLNIFHHEHIPITMNTFWHREEISLYTFRFVTCSIDPCGREPSWSFAITKCKHSIMKLFTSALIVFDIPNFDNLSNVPSKLDDLLVQHVLLHTVDFLI